MYNNKILEQIDILNNAWNEIEHQYKVIANSCSMTSLSHNTLYIIYKSKGGITQKEICKQMVTSKQTLNSALKELEKKELIEVHNCEKDRRIKKIFLSKKGIEFAQVNFPILEDIERKSFSRLEQFEQEQMVSLVIKYARFIKEETEKIFKK